MAVTPRAKWQDLLDMLAARERQQEMSRPAITREFLNPYWDRTELEQTLLESARQQLASLPVGMLESAGSISVVTADYANGAAYPVGTIAALAARMQVVNGDAKWVPAQRLPVRAWFQAFQAPASVTPKYAFVGGNIVHNGYRLHLVLLVEPELADFQADSWILPPVGDEEEILDRAHRWLNIEDFMQGGRI